MIWKHANIDTGRQEKSRGEVQQSTSVFMHDQHGPAGATEGFCAAHRLFPEDDWEVPDGSKSFPSRLPAVSMEGWAGSHCLAIWAGHSDIKKTPPYCSLQPLWNSVVTFQNGGGTKLHINTPQTVTFQGTFYKKHVSQVPHRTALLVLTGQLFVLSPVTHGNVRENWRNHAGERETPPLICFITLLQPPKLGCL